MINARITMFVGSKSDVQKESVLLLPTDTSFLTLLQKYDVQRSSVFYKKTDLECADIEQFHASKYAESALVMQDIRRLAEHHFGSLFLDIIPMHAGSVLHLLFKIVCSNQSYVIKANRPSMSLQAFDFILDQWAYDMISGALLPTLDVFCVDLSRTLVPFDYQITGFQEGHVLNNFEDKETQYMQPELLYALGRFIGKVHTQELSGYGPLSIYSIIQKQSIGLHSRWDTYILLRLDEHLQTCHEINAISKRELDAIKNLFKHYSSVLECKKGVLLHGDLGNHNFLSVDGRSIAALTDWEDCMSGDPLFDVAFWGTFFRDHMLDDFLIGYQSIHQLPHDWQLRYWLYYLRIALSKTVHRHHFGYKDNPMRPAPSLRIQKALAKIGSIAGL